MTRELRLDIGSDSAAARAGLAATARSVDRLADETDKLSDQFRQASRAADGLTDQTKQLGDRFLYAVGAAGRVAHQIDNIGDQARQSARAVDELGDQLGQLGRRGGPASVAGVTKAAAELGVRTGTEAATTFTSLFEGGVISALKNLPPEAQAGLAASLGAAVVLATPVIASAVNAAVITGVGLGGLAAGIALAARDEGVKSAFAELGTEAMKGLTEAAAPFKDQLKIVAQIFREGLADIAPDLSAMFADLATTVAPLARGLVGLAKEALPGIRRAAAAAVPMLEMLANELPDIGAAMSSFFDSIAEGAPGAIAFMKVFLDQVEGGIVGLGAWLGEMGKVLGGAAILADAMGLANFDPSIVAGKIGEVGNAASDVGNAFRDSKREITNWATELDHAFGVTMDQVTATLNLKQALADFKDSLKENRGEWDLNTEAGRRHVAALQAAIQAAYDKMQSDIAAGKSASAAREEFNKTKDSLLEQARAAGATDRELGLLKGTWESFLKTPGTKNLEIRVTQIGSVSGSGVVSGGDPRRSGGKFYATGTMSATPGLHMVHKDEIIDFKGGERVYNRGEASLMMARSRAGTVAPATSGTASGSAGVRTLQPVVLQIGSYQIAKALIEYADTRGITVGRLLGISN